MKHMLRFLPIVLIVSLISTVAIAGVSVKINNAMVTTADTEFRLILQGINFDIGKIGDLVVAIGADIIEGCTVTINETEDIIDCSADGSLVTADGTWTVGISFGNSPAKNDEIDVYISGTTAIQCLAGDYRECYAADMSTKNVGECQSGIRTCQTDGTWGECVGEISPIDEVCDDGLDNDCDGVTDEEECFCNYLGISEGVCDGGIINSNGECVEPQGYVAIETNDDCDGLDNDCDGIVDEECSSSSSTELTGTGGFIVPVGVTEITVELWGGGGGGGGSIGITGLTPCLGAGGGGGGSGGYSKRTITVQPGDAFSYSIGSAGIGGIENGGPGGQSSFYVPEMVTAGGGQGGLDAKNCIAGAGGGGGFGETSNGIDGESADGTTGGSGGSPVISPLDNLTIGGAGGAGGDSDRGSQPGQSGTNGFGIVRW